MYEHSDRLFGKILLEIRIEQFTLRVYAVDNFCAVGEF